MHPFVISREGKLYVDVATATNSCQPKNRQPRESGTERLEEAVAAYRQALMERTRERVPLDWAKTQNNLGAALSRLGERESGTERLEEAVAACREALNEFTQERMPLQWAMAQDNLGDALSVLGQRKGSMEQLEEALSAVESACDAYRRACMLQYRERSETKLRPFGT